MPSLMTALTCIARAVAPVRLARHRPALANACRNCCYGVASIALAVGGVGCGDANASANNSVVVIRVGKAAITKTMINHVVRELELEHVGPHAEGPGPTHHVVVENAVTSLISYDWVIGEATQLKLNPSQHQIEKIFNKEITKSYPTQTARQTYLNAYAHKGYTITDLLLQVRLTLATEKIFQTITNKTPHHTNQTQEQQATAAFIKTWRKQWRAKTHCNKGHVVQKCLNYTGPQKPENPYALN